MADAVSLTYSSHKSSSFGTGIFNDAPWEPSSEDDNPYMTVFFGQIIQVKKLVINSGAMQFTIDYKDEIGEWTTITDGSDNPVVSLSWSGIR